jgi:hypothetical protein
LAIEHRKKVLVCCISAIVQYFHPPKFTFQYHTTDIDASTWCWVSEKTCISSYSDCNYGLLSANYCGCQCFQSPGAICSCTSKIAMHMLREQGPPPPFEPNGAPHGSTGMLGSMMGGSAPIIVMPPNFRHDHRRLRRFIPQFQNLFFLMFACFWYSSCYYVAVKC